ncbi:MAG: transposase [Treponema sp.]|nr:transposase [Treponema sp.]
MVKDLSVRKWVCPVCGAEHEKGENAARNILIEGRRILSANRVCDVSSEETIPRDTWELRQLY